eukprot:361100-Chlamydomonas_euryale.AAC.21
MTVLELRGSYTTNKGGTSVSRMIAWDTHKFTADVIGVATLLWRPDRAQTLARAGGRLHRHKTW